MDQEKASCNICIKSSSDALTAAMTEHLYEAKIADVQKSRNKDEPEHRTDDKASKLKELQHMLSVLKLDNSPKVETSISTCDSSSSKMLEQQAGITNDKQIRQVNSYANKQRFFNPKPIRSKRNIPLAMSKTESTAISDNASDSIPDLQSEINERVDAIEEIKGILNESYSCPSINHSKIIKFERPACIPRLIGGCNKSRMYQARDNYAFSYNQQSSKSSLFELSKSENDNSKSKESCKSPKRL